MVDITWVYPEMFLKFIPRLGGMHWLMSFVGCVGTLMANSGLSEILKSAFAGVEKMLLGKKVPMNVRALRLLMSEILRGHINDIFCFNDLISYFENASSKSITSKHWVENLIKPVLLMMQFMRAEREGEWALNLHACKEMIPYFFAANHTN